MKNKKWIIITKDDENDVEDWQVASHEGLLLKGESWTCVDNQNDLISEINDDTVRVVVVNGKKRTSSSKLEITFDPDNIEAIWIHFGNLSFNDLNTKKKVADNWEKTCKQLNFKIKPGKELEVFPISSQKLPWSDEIKLFRSRFDPQYLENARTKARQYYGIRSP